MKKIKVGDCVEILVGRYEGETGIVLAHESEQYRVERFNLDTAMYHIDEIQVVECNEAPTDQINSADYEEDEGYQSGDFYPPSRYSL